MRNKYKYCGVSTQKNMDGSTKEKRCSLVRKLRQQFSGNPIRRNKCDLKYIARVENKIMETVDLG